MKQLTYILIALILTVAGCGTTKITSSWKAGDVDLQPYKKIMVLALLNESDRSLQEKMEDHLVGDLKELGYDAVSSIKSYGPKAFEKMSEETALGKLNDNNIDAVLTIVLLDKQRERKYVPGNLYYSPYGYYYYHFWNYRGILYHRIYEPGYYVTNTSYFWESNLYDSKSQKLVYSVQTKSFDPSNAESLGHEYGKLIINNMVKQNVLQRQAVTPAGTH